MNKLTTLSLATAFLGAVSMASMTVPAQAEDDVQCFGIAKAGENECASATGTHACAGMSTESYNGGDWKTVSSNFDCHSMGGQLDPFEGVNPIKTKG